MDKMTEPTQQTRLRSALYAACIFVASAAGLIVEIVAARLIAPYVGMSLYTWTAIIAVVLGGMAVGHWIGGRLAQAPPRRSVMLAGTAAGAAAIACAITPILIRVIGNPVLTIDAPQLVLIALLAGLLFFVPSLLIAVLSPILTKLAIDIAPERSGIVIGRMFALGAAGSIIGTLLAGFIFISYVGSSGTLLIVACIISAIAVMLLLLGQARRTAAIATIAWAGIAAMTALRPELVLASACTGESAYYCIRIVDYDSDSGRVGRLMVLDHMGHGINDRDDETLLHSSYVDLTDAIVRRRLDRGKTLRSFFIGGGAYTLPRAWATQHPNGHHMVAEVDPEVTRFARQAMWVRAADNIEIIHEDARHVLQAEPAGPAFDVVIGDAFHDISVPGHLVTREFFAVVKARLAADGLFVMTVIDSRQKPQFLMALTRTARAVFSTVEIWADMDQLLGSQRLTYLVVAGNERGTVGRLASSRFPNREWRRLPNVMLRHWLTDPDVPVLTDDFAPVDRLLHGVADKSG